MIVIYDLSFVIYYIMSSFTFKHIILFFSSIVLIIGTLLSLYFGSYLPFKKSQRYITALRTVQARNVHSIQDFEQTFNYALLFYSPVGDEEVAKFLSNDIARIVSQENQQEAVRRELIRYIEDVMDKNNVRHLLTLGEMYRVLWSTYHRQEDYQKVEGYYRKALTLGPDLPPVLYNVFDLYRSHNDLENALLIAKKIFSLWPDDVKIKTFLDSNMPNLKDKK